jgi:DNA processing protein
VPHIGPVHAKILAETFGSALEIFKAGQSVLERIQGIGEVRARSIKKFRDFGKAEKEILFIERYGIQPLFLTDSCYPKRLLNCYDPPSLLFFKGNADINAPRIVSVVGTRNNSDYGKGATEKLIKELADHDILIVSGLAFGIDSIAHKSALRNAASTVGVMGHGLDIIYPSENANLARDMLKNGGLLTEFRSNTKPDKHNFPSRNRIVAGISDATIIIESGMKGGSMITAEIAYGYNRDIFALPGRTTDSRSSGCNDLVRSNKAILLSEPSQLLETMGWADDIRPKRTTRTQAPYDLTENEKKIIDLLKDRKFLAIDELHLCTGVSGSSLASALLNLEINDITKSLPGKRYMLKE